MGAIGGEDALEWGHKSVRNNVRCGGEASFYGDEIGFTEECKARECGFQTACVCATRAGDFIRKRIETNPDRPLIETVRGVGYRFRVK
jgi:hypothetical protein